MVQSAKLAYCILLLILFFKKAYSDNHSMKENLNFYPMLDTKKKLYKKLNLQSDDGFSFLFFLTL